MGTYIFLRWTKKKSAAVEKRVAKKLAEIRRILETFSEGAPDVMSVPDATYPHNHKLTGDEWDIMVLTCWLYMSLLSGAKIAVDVGDWVTTEEDDGKLPTSLNKFDQDVVEDIEKARDSLKAFVGHAVRVDVKVVRALNPWDYKPESRLCIVATKSKQSASAIRRRRTIKKRKRNIRRRR